MPDLWLVKGEGGVLHPSSEEDANYLKAFKVGDVFQADVSMKRNGKHHRLGMALLREVFNNQDRYNCFESFLLEVKVLTGHVHTHISSSGAVYFIPKSIAFDKMDELEFSRWKSDALTAVFDHFIPRMAPEDQERVINNVLARM